MVMVCSCGTGEQLEISGPSVQEVKLSPGTLEVFYPHSASSVDLSEGHPLFCALKEEESGISFVNEVDDAHPMSRVYILGYACGGISIGDVDADGLVDIYCSGGASDSVLYRQVGDLRFEDVSGESGLSVRGVWSTSSQLVDVDNDGDLDIHVCNYDAPNLLYLNDGQGQFTEVGAAAGIAIKDASLSAHFADYDNDGDLDYYLVINRLIREGGLPTGEITTTGANGKPVLLPEFEPYYAIYDKGGENYTIRTVGRPDRLFENDGSGSFRDVSAESGISGLYYGLSAAWSDYDGDGLVDLYVANDFQHPDCLYHNNGDGSFTNVIRETVPSTPWFSMGSDVADMNNDGLMDFFVLDMAATTHYRAKIAMGDMSKFQNFMDHSEPRQIMRNSLFINSGTRRFMESAWLSGLAASDWSWAVKLSDFDNDGYTDVFITNGMSANIRNPDVPFSLTMLSGREEWQLWKDGGLQRERNQAFRNMGNLRFEKSGAKWGLDHLGASYSAATGDLDRDGDIDLVVASLNEPLQVYRNESAGNRVTLSLRGISSNRYGLGALIRAEWGSERKVSQLNPMTGFSSCNEPIVHFGIGEAKRIDYLEVTWPGGRQQAFYNVRAGAHYIMAESKGDAPEEDLILPKALSPMFASVPLPDVVRHTENSFDDFALQPLLPNKLSRLGPGVSVGDVDGNGSDDFVVSSARNEVPHVHLNAEGGIRRHLLTAAVDDSTCEDLGTLLFDADRDGDLDIYIVSGGVEAERASEQLRDRLYLNRGQGEFFKAPADALPEKLFSGSAVCAADFDRDGDLDLFVGGRLRRGEYPLSPGSSLLCNESGKAGEVLFVDRTEALAEGLEGCGMVTSALWSDANGDGWVDLLLAEEWGRIRLFLNREGKLVDSTAASGLAGYRGWWNGLAGRDLDGDGDMDYVATNCGLNTKYHPSENHPVRLYYGTFGGHGRASIVEAKVFEDCLLPVRGKSCSQNAMPFVKKKFPTYHDFASATLKDIYSENSLREANLFEVNYLESSVLINQGDGSFKLSVLPALAQMAPCFGVVATEVNGDGNADIYVVQNFYHPQRETGKMAGGMSVLLLGDGSGSFEEVWPHKSGLVVPEDARGLSACDWNADGWVDFSVGVNNGKMKLYENQGKSQFSTRTLAIGLAGRPGNPTCVGAMVRLELVNGSIQADEVRAGGSYISQSSPELFFGLGEGEAVSSIKVRWPDGTQSEHQHAPGKTRMRIRQDEG